MAKKTTTTPKAAASAAPTATLAAIPQKPTTPAPAKRLTVTRTASTPKAPPAPAAKVTTARKAAPKPKAPAAPKVAAKRPAAPRKARALSPITHDDIAVRAYLIAEKRHAHGHHAEPHDDWAEAERQLQAERAGAR